MKDGRTALRYAKAIINLAIENKSEVEVNNDMKVICSTIAESDDLKVMLKSPIIKSSDKVNVLNALFPDANGITKGLFNLLQENKRMVILELIARKYTILFDQYKGTKVAIVTTAVPLTKELEDKIQAKVVALTGNNVAIENIIDESILGGFILKVGDKQFDASISSKFGNLQRAFDSKDYQAKI